MTPTGVRRGTISCLPKLSANIVVLCVFLACQGSIDAATTNRRPPQSTNPTRGNSKVMEPAFENAGRSPGVEIWRIENFKPVAYPKKDYGKFYSGDSYIALYTKQNKRGDLSWNIHFWLGQQTTQDEAGAAAILSVQLDDQLGGEPIQYREVQEHESQHFLSYFKNGVRYLPGGVNSGFTHVDRNAVEKRLFQIKGKRNIRVKQVDLTVASMNKGDCFILDVGKDIYVYVGQKSKRVERLKAISAANNIRDQDHSGRSRIHVIDEFSDEGEVEAFFNNLGSGSPNEVPDESAGGDDQDFEREEERSVNVYRVSDASGKMNLQKVSSKPLQQSVLDTNDCFILETGESNIYVWIGKKCNNKEKSEAMSKAQNFLSSEHYPSWTQVVRVVEGGEPSIFQQYFQTWRATGQLHSRLIRSANVEETKLDVKSAGEVPEFMPDDGSGEVEIFRVENYELVPVDPETYGKFFGGDSYVIKYNYNNKWIIYIWQGNQSSLDETWSAAFHAAAIGKELGGKATQIRVKQDNENKHFLHIFKGKLITFLGGHASGFKNIREYDTYVAGETRMFRVRGTSEENVRASEQLPKASSLESDDVFIVENGNNTWIWIGKDSDEVEKQLASGFVEHIAPDSEVSVIQEGEEPEEFWDTLGGKEDYKDSFENNLRAVTDPRLFHVQYNQRGRLIMEEIKDFEQTDLNQDDVMLLDNSTVLYAWIGSNSTEDEKKAALKTAQVYLSKNDREQTVIVVINEEEEPEGFTSLFPSWDPELWEKLTTYSETKARLEDFNNTIGDDD